MLAIKDQMDNSECIVKVLGHVVVSPNVVVGYMDYWDGLYEWARHGLGPCMLVWTIVLYVAERDHMVPEMPLSTVG